MGTLVHMPYGIIYYYLVNQVGSRFFHACLRSAQIFRDGSLTPNLNWKCKHALVMLRYSLFLIEYQVCHEAICATSPQRVNIQHTPQNNNAGQKICEATMSGKE